MRFVGSAVVRITFNVKTLQQLSHIVVHKSSGNKLRNFQIPPAVPCPHLVVDGSSGVGTVAAVAALAATLFRAKINIHNLL